MSYKKIVAGVATFAIASAMVVPAAFATEATTQPAAGEEVTSAQMEEEAAEKARHAEFLKMKEEAVKKAEELLKCLAKFNDRTYEVKVGAYLETNQNVAAIVQEQLARVKAMQYDKNALNELRAAVNVLNNMEKYVNAFMKMDPAALEKACKKGCSDKKADKAAGKATAAKGGKHLPKTADAAPVAPFAAVAGSAALIAAGLVASRKVNA